MPKLSLPAVDISLHYLIYQCLALVDLLAFAHTSHGNRAKVKSYIAHRIRKELVHFTPNVDNFLTLLDETSAVVSGSSALRLTLPESEVLTTPPHLTVYVPRDTSQAMADRMLQQGFELLTNTPRNFNKTLRTITFRYREHKIRVIISAAANSALLPIMYGETTFMMNYYTGKSLFLAYPVLTFLKRGIHNPLACHRTRFRCGGLAALAGESSDLRFRVESSVTSRISDVLRCNVTHTCGVNYCCAMKIRNSNDKGCLHLSLQAEDGQPKDDEETILEGPEDGITIQWRIGGRACHINDHSVKSPFAYIL